MSEWIEDWQRLAACRGGDPDALFVQGAEQNVAKKICKGCPVRLECGAVALDNRIEFGVWGGMTERERRALLRRHPGAASWTELFRIAKEAMAAPRAGDTALLQTVSAQQAEAVQPEAAAIQPVASPQPGEPGVQAA